MKIKKLKLSDLNVCAKLLEVAYSVPPFNEKWQSGNSYKYLLSKFKYCGKYSYSLTEEGDIRGFILVSLSCWSDGPQAIIEEIVIDPNYQHQGLGSKLVKYVDSKLKVKSILLWTNKKSLGHKFHKKNGFSDVSELVIMSKNFK